MLYMYANILQSQAQRPNLPLVFAQGASQLQAGEIPGASELVLDTIAKEAFEIAEASYDAYCINDLESGR